MGERGVVGRVGRMERGATVVQIYCMKSKNNKTKKMGGGDTIWKEEECNRVKVSPFYL